MPWIWPNGVIHEGTITKVVDPEGDACYHVDAMIGSEHVEGGMVFEREVVQEETE